MTDEPTVSVVIPTYKRPSKLLRAVQSVVNQSYQDWELIVVNDDPDTDIGDLLPDNPSIRSIQHQINQGAPVARNNGIEASEGDFIALLDDDDAWKPKKLELQIEHFKSLNDTYAVVYSGRDIVYNDDTIETYIPEQEGWLEDILLQKNVIPSETPLIRKDCLTEVDMFDPDFPSLQDLDLWVRISKEYKISPVKESLALSYRGHTNRIGRDVIRKYKGHKRFMDKYRTELLSNPKALAKHERQAGVYASLAGQRWQGFKYLLRAFKRNPRSWPILYEFSLCVTPSLLQKRLLDFRNRFASRSDSPRQDA